MQKIVLVDDLDQSTHDVDTVRFSLDGSHYEIDLSGGNAAELRTMLAPYQAVARPSRPYTEKPKDRTPAGSRKRTSSKRSRSGPSPAEVRQWAVSKGIDVNPTGRVPKTLVEQFLADK